MNKRVFIIHGWGGNPDEAWMPWLREELKKKGIEPYSLPMPNTENPVIEEWVSFLSAQVGEPDKNTYFIGHSIGCQAILRYIEQLPQEAKIGGIVCVAGFFNLQGLETEEEKILAKPWLETKIDFEKIKTHTNKIIAIFSDNDPFVGLENKELFEKHLDAKTFIEHDKGHFDDAAEIKELPIVLKELLEIIK